MIQGQKIPDKLLPLLSFVFLFDAPVSPSIQRRIFDTNPVLLSPEFEAAYVLTLEMLRLNDSEPPERIHHSENRLILLRRLKDIGIDNILTQSAIEPASPDWILFLSSQLGVIFSWSALHQLLSNYSEILTDEALEILEVLTMQMKMDQNAVAVTTLVLQQRFLKKCREFGVSDVIEQLRETATSDHMTPFFVLAGGILEFTDAQNLDQIRFILTSKPELLTKQALGLFDFLIEDVSDEQNDPRFIHSLMQRRAFLQSCVEQGLDNTISVMQKSESIHKEYGRDLINLVQTLISLPNWQQTALMVMTKPVLLEQKTQDLLDWMLQQVNKLDDDPTVAILKKHQVFLQVFREKGVAAALQAVMDDGDDNQ